MNIPPNLNLLLFPNVNKNQIQALQHFVVCAEANVKSWESLGLWGTVLGIRVQAKSKYDARPVTVTVSIPATFSSPMDSPRHTQVIRPDGRLHDMIWEYDETFDFGCDVNVGPRCFRNYAQLSNEHLTVTLDERP